jgi:hypothetical protein
MYFQGVWQTLLDINPELDFNWNIACMVSVYPYGQNLYYNLYRETNQGGFQLYHKVYNIEYHDNNINLADHYCYRITKMVINNGDTCESDPTNTACETINVGITQPGQNKTFSIFPNPAKYWLNIQADEEIREIRISNALGERVLKLEIGNWDYQMDVSRLQNGIYYISADLKSRNVKAKFIILK